MRIGKRLECRSGQRFEKARMPRQPPFVHQDLRAVVHAKIVPRKFLVADRLAIDPNALIHADQVWRCIQPAPVSGALQNRGQRRGGRSLAVRPRNQDRPKPPLRMPQRLHQRAHFFEAKLPPRLPRRGVQLPHTRMKTVERRRIGHSSILASIPGQLSGTG